MNSTPQWEDPRKVLSRHGLAPKRAFSQSFLISRHIVEAIARAAVAAPGQPVVELGAGLGTLTAALASAGARVHAVERDRDMVKVLEAEFAETPAVEVTAGDAARLDFGALAARHGGKIAVVGNIPYAITGSILKRLMASRDYLLQAVLTVQREVRDRLTAAPGGSAYGALTVFIAAGFEVETLMHVPASAFHPRPKVDSSVVRLTPRAAPPVRETPAFRQIVRAAFQQRRKTLRNALKQAKSGLAAGRVDAALRAAAIDGRRRGETLSLDEFARLAAAWEDIPRR